jgi:hypothetical protein
MTKLLTNSGINAVISGITVIMKKFVINCNDVTYARANPPREASVDLFRPSGPVRDS